MFIPPINLGGWKPSPATMSEWIYQIWKYLQENPIATQDQIKQYIEEQIGDDIAKKLPDILPEELDAYFEEHPIDFPVDSVNGKLGAVLLELADIVKSDSMLPVVSLANDEADQVTLVNAFIDGARICVIDEKSVSVMLPTYGLDGGVSAVTLLPVGTGGEGGDFSPITLSIGSSGNKTLNAGGVVAFTLQEIGAAPAALSTTVSGLSSDVSDIQGDISEIQQDISNLQSDVSDIQSTPVVITDNSTNSTSKNIAGLGNADFLITIPEHAGYEAVGIVGASSTASGAASGAVSCSLRRYGFYTDNTVTPPVKYVRITIQNNQSSQITITSATAFILYAKSVTS